MLIKINKSFPIYVNYIFLYIKLNIYENTITVHVIL